MLTPRIFVGADARPVPGADYALADAAARHVAHVLRMRIGDRVALFTGAGGEYQASIAHIDRRHVLLTIDRHEAVERESPWQVTLVQAIIAADLMDLTVRKAVELGVAAIAPVQAARSQNVPAARAERRAAHWRQIAIAACEQCGRNRLPDIAPVRAFADWLDSASATTEPMAILDASAAASLARLAAAATPRTIAIGPEGGFAPEEIRGAVERGATPVHLGARTLRAETAALAALATINALAGDAR